MEVLRGLKATFTRSMIKDARLEDVMLSLYDNDNSDPCVAIVKKYYDGQGVKESDVLSSLLSCLYRIGAIGVKTGAMDTYIWCYVDQAAVTRGEIKRVEHMKIHKMLYRALDVITDQREIFEAEDLD
ncbi:MULTISPECIES: hypothetical protein [Pseudomonas]|uniref:hypothetical protein n=1 Tax=Pseudomonas TaxID=286 RepID=UPI0021156E9A|nr:MULTISPECIES: hypothetical protein [Pseudomonas]